MASGILSNKDITDSFNYGKADRERFTPQRIGRKLKALGFDRAKTGTGAAAMVFDEKMLNRLMEAYGLKETSETPETPVMQEN